MLFLYKTLTIILYPLIIIYLYYRQIIGKENSLRIKERFGKSSIERPQGKLIWLHAISIGEIMSVLPLIQIILDKNPTINMLITTGTVSSAEIMSERLPDRAFHQFIPVDSIICIKRFLRYWNPDLIFWIESELWPNLLTESRRYSKIVMLNGRISKQSVNFWLKFPTICNEMINVFDLILTQSDIDKERFLSVGAKNIKFLGNLKVDAPPLPYDPRILSKFINFIGERHVWLAASTHEGEEKIIANVHFKLKKEKFPDLLTIIAPRHRERGKDIVNELSNISSELKIALRSKNNLIEDDTDIYISDTIGELGIYYRLTNIVFIGGSLVPIGGHNPIEALRLENVVLFGPYMDNFLAISHELQSKKAGIMVQDENELHINLEKLLLDYDKQESFIKASNKMIENRKGVLEITYNEINNYIKAIN